MNKSPLTVQQWLETLPAPNSSTPVRDQVTPPRSGNAPPSGMYSGAKPSLRLLARDASVQSDDCSHCSSVESVLEFRRPDPEAVLLGLGFGPPSSGPFSTRIPQRFLQPSKLLTQIDINKFLEDQGEVQYLEQQFATNPSSPARAKSKAS